MTAHAKLSASGAHRWMACPGSVAAEDGIPDRTSSFAEEGTRAHDLMECALINNRPCSDFTTDNEMAEYVQIYVDYVEAARAKMGNNTWMFIERRVDFSEWVPDGFGTADTIIVSDEVIHIIDLKFGKGVQVYAENNPQAQLYALGAYAELGFISNPQTVRISIVQPRLDHIDEWELSTVDLLKFGETVRQAALDTANPNAKRVPGEKQCRFCKAKATCPALFKLTEQTLMADFEQLDEAPPANKLTDKQMRVVLENKTLVESWLLAVENLAKEKIASGASFPGFKLVEGRAIRRWSDETAAADRLLGLTRIEDVYTRKLISPAQAEKLLGKKDKAAIEDLIEKPRGSPTIAREDDPRPAIIAAILDFESLDDK